MSADTVPKEQAMTASEILALQLPGLPRSKSKLLARAEREGWPFEERVVRGGAAKLFQLPSEYLDGAMRVKAPALPRATVADEAMAHARSMEDGDLLQDLVVAVENFFKDNNLEIDAARKGAYISVLYRYFREEGVLNPEKLTNLLRDMAA